MLWCTPNLGITKTEMVAGTTPTRTSLKPNTAVSTAMAMSQAAMSPMPPPNAGRSGQEEQTVSDTLRIANCSGFYGDRLSAAREMVEGGPIDVLTGDYLAELTLMILLKDRLRDPNLGYARTFLRQLEEIAASDAPPQGEPPAPEEDEPEAPERGPGPALSPMNQLSAAIV